MGKNVEQSVVHFTKGGNFGGYGDRNPAVWINYLGQITVATALSGNHNFFFVTPTKFPLKTWISVEISQKKEGDKVRI